MINETVTVGRLFLDGKLVGAGEMPKDEYDDLIDQGAFEEAPPELTVPMLAGEAGTTDANDEGLSHDEDMLISKAEGIIDAYATGGGWYEVDGTKVQGKTAAVQLLVEQLREKA